ncbi:MAG: hypothetical protein LDLANPLL_02022 [Turneriella sp.]|nr:hypothetical protein [Turneriella sp.]
MFIERVATVLARSREHWLFVPFFILLILTVSYVFFIGEKGYLAYRVKLQEREELKLQIESFVRQKKELQDKLALLSDKEQAVSKFTKDFYLFQEKVRILKFREEAEDKPMEENVAANLAATQKFFVIFSTILIALVTLFFYRRNNARMNMDKVRPFDLQDNPKF